MLKLSLTMHRRHPGHSIKAVLQFTDRVSHKEMKENVDELMKKLQQLIPGSFRVKYVENPDGLVLTASVSKLPEAHSMQQKLASYIKTAATAMNMKLMG